MEPRLTVTSLVKSPHHYGHPGSVPYCIPQCKLAPCNKVTSPLRSLLPSPVGDLITEVPMYKAIRKSLAHIDWNDKMKNKTTTECWNILRGELDSVVDSYVPMKKQGKRSKKKHLSKEAFRKIRYNQNL